jgi:cytolysin (calcineurin-like family phosphatase)
MRHRIIILFLCSIFGIATGDGQDFSFIVISDTHYGTEGARENTQTTLSNINQFQTKIRPQFRIFNLPQTRGLVHCGDILDQPNDTSYQYFVDDFGLRGENLCKFPVYELFGNHDGGFSDPVRQGMIKRNPGRPNIRNISENGLHYSWKWGEVLLIALNSYPGNEWDDSCGWCHYFKDSFKFPQYSLAFLEQELKSIENPNQPVILFQHYGWDGFSFLWWTEAERNAYYELIKDYNILGIFHGHNHAVERRNWNGIPVWAVGSPQKTSEPGEFVVARVRKNHLKVFARKGDQWKKIPKVN